MKPVSRSTVFKKWFKKLKDRVGKAIIYARVDRLASGNPGDSRFLGDISELRIDYGPGYRVYYIEKNKKIIILLCGGDKSSQHEDIEKARNIAKLYEGA